MQVVVFDERERDYQNCAIILYTQCEFILTKRVSLEGIPQRRALKQMQTLLQP